MQPHRYTELFFLDDATALAAGHRPCAECRRKDFVRFTQVWRELHGDAGAHAIDARLHGQRIDPETRGHRLHAAEAEELPDGAFVLHDRVPKLVLGDELLAWAAGGYVARGPRPSGSVALVTPPALVAVLRSDWRPTAVPLLHPSTALRQGAGREPGP